MKYIFSLLRLKIRSAIGKFQSSAFGSLLKMVQLDTYLLGDMGFEDRLVFSENRNIKYKI
jgi:hypothetical protein